MIADIFKVFSWPSKTFRMMCLQDQKHKMGSVAEVQFRTDAENWNRWNRTESSVQSGSGSLVLAAVRFSVLRILQNSWTVWEPVKIYSWNVEEIPYVWCGKPVICPICQNKAVIELYQQGFRSFEWLVIAKYDNSLSISCFLALVPSKSIRTKKFNLLQLVFKV